MKNYECLKKYLKAKLDNHKIKEAKTECYAWLCGYYEECLNDLCDIMGLENIARLIDAMDAIQERLASVGRDKELDLLNKQFEQVTKQINRDPAMTDPRTGGAHCGHQHCMKHGALCKNTKKMQRRL